MTKPIASRLPSPHARRRGVVVVDLPGLPDPATPRCQQDLHHVAHRDLRALLPDLNPACLVFDPFATQFDGFDLLRGLVKAGYRGRVVALVPPLPDPAMVRHELRKCAPGLRVTLLRFPDPG